MDEYIIFVVVHCKSRKILLVTSSARKAGALLDKGVRIEVWSDNNLCETIYYSTKSGPHPLGPYIERQRRYIGQKQLRAQRRNQRKTPKVVS